MGATVMLFLEGHQSLIIPDKDFVALALVKDPSDTKTRQSGNTLVVESHAKAILLDPVLELLRQNPLLCQDSFFQASPERELSFLMVPTGLALVVIGKLWDFPVDTCLQCQGDLHQLMIVLSVGQWLCCFTTMMTSSMEIQ